MPQRRPERPARLGRSPRFGATPRRSRLSAALGRALVVAIGALLLLVGPMASSAVARPGHVGRAAPAGLRRSFVAMKTLPAEANMSKLHTEAFLPEPAK